jgi:predicted flavoprotein YhiN
MTNLTPSLTPIITSKFDKRLEGKRTKVNVKLFRNGNLVKIEDGEMLFKKDGVSGIVMFNMSSYLARQHIDNYEEYYFIIDLLPKISYHQYLKFRSIDPSLRNIMQEDIAREVTSRGIDPKEMLLEIKGLYDFKNSQVTCGGVKLNELNFNLSLKKDNNIYIAGETIDIDGECGGYNIEFAFLSGIQIGRFFNE